jgi:hypothetical protein
VSIPRIPTATKMSDDVALSWNSRLREGVDWDRVAEQINGWELPIYDCDQIFHHVLEAAKKCVPFDLAEGNEVIGIEVERERDGLKGITDLTVIRTPEELRIIDWKTTGSVDAKWASVHTKGWQGGWYGYIWEPEAKGRKIVVEFRGLERGTGKWRVLPIEITKELLDETYGNATRVRKLRSDDIWAGHIRFGGYTCHSFGRSCEYLGDACNANLNMSYDEMKALDSSPISPTSAERIRTCPHKNTLYQLDKLRKVEQTGGGSNEKADYGNAFHSGIAEVYKQLTTK